jgi:hypothetical protein
MVRSTGSADLSVHGAGYPMAGNTHVFAERDHHASDTAATYGAA